MRSSLVSFPERSQCSSHRLEGCKLCNVAEGTDLPYKAESLRLHVSQPQFFIQLDHIQLSKHLLSVETIYYKYQTLPALL